MSIALTHLVLTRFNLRFPEFQADKNGSSVADQAWMDHRLELFARICLPSMVAQEAKHWRWLIYCDVNTLPQHRERLDQLQRQHPCFELVWLPDKRVPEHIRSLDLPAGRLLTTRLDNDDAFHPKALATIADHASRTPSIQLPRLLSFRFGLRSDGQRAQIVHHRLNPFLSLVERCEPGQQVHTVLAGAHGHMRRIAPLSLLPDLPYHLTVIHERNAANRFTDDCERFRLTTLRGWKRLVKYRIMGGLRRRLWPADLRRERSWQEIVETFHIDPRPLPEECPSPQEAAP